MWRRGKLTFVLATTQFVVVVLYTLWSYYGHEADASNPRHSYNPPITVYGSKHEKASNDYSMVGQYIQSIVLFMGISLTLSANYSVSGIGQTFLTTALVLQLTFVWRLVLVEDRITMDLSRLWISCNAVLSVNVACRSVQGHLSNLQHVFFVVVASFCYEVNLITTQKFVIHDMFPSMRVLVFGSLFGFGASLTCNRNTMHKTMRTSASIHILLICSSVMEYCMWPLVFSGSTTDGKQHRIILNTILSESAAVVASYAAASLINPHNLYDVKSVQLGVTGGAVAVSAVCGYMLYPAGALLVGSAGAVLSIISFHVLMPYARRKVRVPMDPFHVVSSYSLPGLLSALLSVVYSALASEADYGLTLYEMFPARSPKSNTSELEELMDLLPRISAGDGRTAGDQALMQVVTIVTTIALSVATGAITGVCFRSSWIESLEKEQILSDDSNWNVPSVLMLGNENGGDGDVIEPGEGVQLSGVVRTRNQFDV